MYKLSCSFFLLGSRKVYGQWI